jgi:hypothetical protein
MLKNTIVELKNNKFFVVFALFIFIVIFALENLNNRFWLNDFKVYYLAAKALLNGEEVYKNAFGLGTGFYKYSPFILLLFTPFCVFTYYVACTIQYSIIALATIGSIIIIKKIINQYFFSLKNKQVVYVLILSLAAISMHVFREVQLGNVNMLLVLILMLGLYFVLNSKLIVGGIFIALAIMVKPYFLLLMLPLILYKKYKVVLSSFFSVVVFLIIPFLILGITKGFSLHQNWVESMAKHSSYLKSAETIYSLVQYYFYSNAPSYFQYLIILLVLSLLVLFYFYTNKNNTEVATLEANNNLNFIVLFISIIAVIPNLLITDTEHFLFALPVIMVIISYLFYSKNYYQAVFFGLLYLLNILNSSDILGNELFDKISKMGPIGITNLINIGFLFYMNLKNKITIKI